MDFEWDEEQRLFREKVRAFIANNLPDNWEDVAGHGPGSAELTHMSRQFCGALADEDMLFPHWPVELGGQGADPWHQQILAEEMWAAGEPRGAQYMNVNWIGPTLVRYGTEIQKERYLPPIVKGDAIWCQGFSEPGAGSDLAGLRTRAVLEDGKYRINGQKIWTSYAGLAETCFMLVRTAEDRHTGITILLVPMDTPGITVREIPSIIGDGDIHEVFLDDVIVPADARLGEEGHAWEIINYSLRNERLGIPRYQLARAALDRAVATLRDHAAFDDDSVQIEAARAASMCEAARSGIYAIVSRRSHGEEVGPEAAAARFATVMAERAVSEFVVEYLPGALASSDPFLRMHHQRGIVAGIASGAAEIQLNIIASSVLQLPREPR
ncbi:MAG: acyl-CoA dehydrogenase family protein [Sphingomonadaceae bacterium]|nr:acyl-CoA dehydrogenase family protein [Sphingomonadaceae bacterium]